MLFRVNAGKTGVKLAKRAAEAKTTNLSDRLRSGVG